MLLVMVLVMVPEAARAEALKAQEAAAVLAEAQAAAQAQVRGWGGASVRMCRNGGPFHPHTRRWLSNFVSMSSRRRSGLGLPCAVPPASYAASYADMQYIAGGAG